MRTLLVVFAALAGAAWQTPPAAPARPRILGVAHVSIQTSDLFASD